MDEDNKFLRHPTVPLKVSKGKSVGTLLNEMLGTGFQGRKLAECYQIWKSMLGEESITIWLGISGAIVPAGMRELIAYLIEKRMVDVVVSTGAQIFHDICEALGVLHFQGSPMMNDEELYDHKIDRFHDILVKEELQRKVDRKIQTFIESLDPNYQYSSREFLNLLGKYVEEQAVNKQSILIQAVKAGVPIYVPALSDSSIGYSFVMARHGVEDSPDGKGVRETAKKTFRFVDQIKDTDETVQIAGASKKSGVIYLGGGVPKNFVQQTELLNLIIGRQLPGHEYAIQITTDNPAFGGLSGCTLGEAISWGKISKAAKMSQCFSDITIALPFLVQGLSEVEDLARRRPKPNFNFKKEQVEITYK
ncbi:MAG: deoxyhypusine synthase family protein [Candidatus Saganbacteria bacterium]|nr:deoxyhypusine synthase family protein [Candidatus Saganbacteria bacterium]